MIPPHNPQNFAANIPICHACPARSAGLCADGVEIRHHADAGYCPEQRYAVNIPEPAGWRELEVRGSKLEVRENQIPTSNLQPQTSVPLAGDLAAAALAKIGAATLALWWEKISGVGCGCAGRQEKLNRFDRAVRRKLRLRVEG